ncbi:MAG: hypothetical protein OXI72_06015 [Gemmatimonadota bacterium]|nr:hypothetical protein [Gemmatimonadota bacterium]
MTYRSLLIVCLATLGLAVAGWGQADGKIAFLSRHEGRSDVWIMNADGSVPINLTPGRHLQCVSPAWSPDGTKIAYLAFDDLFDSDGVLYVDYSQGAIWVMDADGGNPQQVGYLVDPGSESGSEEIFWAEDGSRIYYYRRGSPNELFAVELGGSGSSPVDWKEGAGIARRFRDNRSPDGTKRADVVLQDDEGNAYLRLVSFAPSEGPQPSKQIEDFSEILLPDLPYQQAELEPGWERMSDPTTWSPDSMRIAFSAASEQGDDEIWVVDIDGSNLVNLTNGLGGRKPSWQPTTPAATSVEVQSWGRIKARLSTGIH